jgi:hypothetical protein
MSRFLTPVALGLALLVGAIPAQAQQKPPSQDLVAVCDKAAGNRKGDDRKAFIKSCIAARTETSQDKMAGCDHARAEDL